jgi:hypothetical protein
MLYGPGFFYSSQDNPYHSSKNEVPAKILTNFSSGKKNEAW